jgi:hypothetical protein
MTAAHARKQVHADFENIGRAAALTTACACRDATRHNEMHAMTAAHARKQVHADFENIGRAAALSTVCLYGGAPLGPQEGVLRRGADVVVGTPGRVKDHLERGSLKLQELQCAARQCSSCSASSAWGSSCACHQQPQKGRCCQAGKGCRGALAAHALRGGSSATALLGVK